MAIIEQFYLIIRHSHNILLWGYYYSGLMGGYASFFLPYLYVSTKISVIVSMVVGLVRMIHTYFIDAIVFDTIPFNALLGVWTADHCSGDLGGGTGHHLPHLLL